MNTQPTPETDSEEIIITKGKPTHWVSQDFARKLERERDELHKAVNGLCNHLQVSPANTTLLAVEILKIERERNEARDQRDKLAEALHKVSRSWNYVEVAREALQSLTPNEL